MKSEEDKFGESLRSVVDGKEFPFTENEWDRASAYISRKRAGRRRRLAGLLLLVSFGVALLFIWQAPENSGVVAELPSNTVVAEALDIHPSPEKASPKTVSKNNQQPKRDPERVEPIQPEARKTGKPVESHVATTRPSGKKPSTDPVKQHSQVSVDITLAQVEAESSQPAEQVQGNVSENTDDQIEGNNRDVTQADTAEDEVPAIRDTGTPEQTAAVNNEDAGALTQASVVTEKTDPTAPVTAPAETVQPAEKPALVAENTGDPDSAVSMLTPHLMLEAGADWLSGWHSGSKEADGFNPVIGLHYASIVTTRVRLSVGAQYIRIANLSSFTHTSASTVLSFGEESEITRITPRRLHYAGAALRLTYERGRNAFGIGYSVAYLVDVQSDVETYSLINNERNNLRNFTSRGYTDGFRMFDSRVSVIYRRALMARLWLHAEIFSGLSDIKEDGFFLQQGSQRPFGARLGISYRLNK